MFQKYVINVKINYKLQYKKFLNNIFFNKRLKSH